MEALTSMSIVCWESKSGIKAAWAVLLTRRYLMLTITVSAYLFFFHNLCFEKHISSECVCFIRTFTYTWTRASLFRPGSSPFCLLILVQEAHDGSADIWHAKMRDKKSAHAKYQPLHTHLFVWGRLVLKERSNTDHRFLAIAKELQDENPASILSSHAPSFLKSPSSAMTEGSKTYH